MYIDMTISQLEQESCVLFEVGQYGSLKKYWETLSCLALRVIDSDHSTFSKLPPPHNVPCPQNLWKL